MVLVQALPGLLVEGAVHLGTGGIQLQQVQQGFEPGPDLQQFEDLLLLTHFSGHETGHGVDGLAQGQLADLVHAEQTRGIGVPAQESLHRLVEGLEGFTGRLAGLGQQVGLRPG